MGQETANEAQGKRQDAAPPWPEAGDISGAVVWFNWYFKPDAEVYRDDIMGDWVIRVGRRSLRVQPPKIVGVDAMGP